MATLPLARYYRYMFLPGLLLFLAPMLLRTYLLSPFPGSQMLDALDTVYFLEKIMLPAQILGIILMIGPIINVFLHGSRLKRVATVFLCVFLVGVYFMTNFKMSAEKFFQEPKEKRFATVAENKVELDRYVIGVVNNGEAKAYPVQFIAYHHKVQDSVGGMPVLVTYCSMCHTGRVFDPVVDGTYQQFRLVGARQYNAVIEDESTGTWWYQATGEAAAGPKTGSRLKEIPYEQIALSAWIEAHPNTLIMQADPAFTAMYQQFEEYEFMRELEPDSTTGVVPKWDISNWVVGVDLGNAAKAFEWNDLTKVRVVNDAVGTTPVVVALEKDSLSYHVWNRAVDGATLEFRLDSAGHGLRDAATSSLWNWRGEAVEGSYQGKRLAPVQGHQEYWHSWKTFHPKTEQWELK